MGRYAYLKQHMQHNKSAAASVPTRALAGAGVGGLLGAGLGGGLGLLHEAFIAKPEDAQYMRRAIQGLALGGLAGAGLGAGVGASSVGSDIDKYLEERARIANVLMAEQIASQLSNVNIVAKNVPLAGNVPIVITYNSEGKKDDKAGK